MTAVAIPPWPALLWLLLPLVSWDILQHHSQEGVPTVQWGWGARMKLMSREPGMVTADVLVGVETGLKGAGGREGLGLCRGSPQSLGCYRPPQPSLHSNRVVNADYTITGGHKSLCRLSNQAPRRSCDYLGLHCMAIVSSDHLGLHCMATVSQAPRRCQGQIARPLAQLLNLMSCILIRVLHSTEVPVWPRRIDWHRS